MKRAPISYRKPPWTKEQLARFAEIERNYHIRTFGEELARVNLDLTIQERWEYVAWMRKAAHARKKPESAPTDEVP